MQMMQRALVPVHILLHLLTQVMPPQDLWFCDSCTTAGREQLVRKAKAAQLAARATAKPTSAKALGSALKSGSAPRVKRRSGAVDPVAAAAAASRRAEQAASDTSR